MHEGTQLRWIAEAEARRHCDLALVQQAASEPYIGIAASRAGPAWLDRLRAIIPTLVRTAVCGPSFSEVHADRVLVTVLFTDIVEATRRATEIGDRQWRALLDRHDYALRHQIRRFRGREIKNLGDGFLATFDSPARAVRCASSIAEALAPLGVAVRCGLHTGEIEQRRNDISGIAVNIAARVAAMAGPNETLVSSTVRDLVAGSGLRFDDRGLHGLKGLPLQVHLYSADDGV